MNKYIIPILLFFLSLLIIYIFKNKELFTNEEKNDLFYKDMPKEILENISNLIDLSDEITSKIDKLNDYIKNINSLWELDITSRPENNGTPEKIVDNINYPSKLASEYILEGEKIIEISSSIKKLIFNTRTNTWNPMNVTLKRFIEEFTEDVDDKEKNSDLVEVIELYTQINTNVVNYVTVQNNIWNDPNGPSKTLIENTLNISEIILDGKNTRAYKSFVVCCWRCLILFPLRFYYPK